MGLPNWCSWHPHCPIMWGNLAQSESTKCWFSVLTVFAFSCTCWQRVSVFTMAIFLGWSLFLAHRVSIVHHTITRPITVSSLWSQFITVLPFLGPNYSVGMSWMLCVSMLAGWVRLDRWTMASSLNFFWGQYTNLSWKVSRCWITIGFSLPVLV